MAVPPAENLMSNPRVRFAIAAAVVALAIIGMVVFSLKGSTAYYVTPGELAAGPIRTNDHVRVAGNVVDGTIARNGSTTTFDVTDGTDAVTVTTEDLLPDTFAAGVEVVAEGAMTTRGVFSASKVLAKCPSKFKAKVQAKADAPASG
jgi:cytochrome c-type biogenesis protein CcmE